MNPRLWLPSSPTHQPLPPDNTAILHFLTHRSSNITRVSFVPWRTI